MRKSPAATAATAALPVALPVAQALVGADPAAAQGSDRGWGQSREARLFDRVDGDGDPRITRAEVDSALEARIELMDTNATGPVELDEMARVGQARMALRMDGRPAKRFERLDANGDGAVVRGEFVDGAAQRFRRLDADGDGALTRDEIEGGIRHGGG